MKKTSKVISLRKRKLRKKYKHFISKKKFFIFFLGIPIIITSILVLDNQFVKMSLNRKGIAYNHYINVNFDYINQVEGNKYQDIKKYYIYKEKIKNYMVNEINTKIK